ncbi:MAG: glycosyltransferase [Armatimonadota bacterium]
MDSDFQRLLVVNDYPPSTVAGAPVIVRQLLRRYDPDRLHILCCDQWHSRQTDVVRGSFLPCRHTAVPGADINRLRPRRVFVPLSLQWNFLRIGRIVAEGRRIIREEGIEAIFTSTCSMEFSLAAARLAREFNLPLHVFETDDWIDANPKPLAWLLRAERARSLRDARQVWTTSPAMVRSHRAKYGVESEFLFHFVDLEGYQTRTAGIEPPTDRIRITYTGSINGMFQETMERFCDWLNAGVDIEGLPVEMVILTQNEPKRFLGSRVSWGGYVPMEEVPIRLRQGHLAAILVSFTDQPALKGLIKTSLYTKTVDYLAAGSPTLVVSPPYSGEVDYFGDVTYVVDTWDTDRIREAIRRLALDSRTREDLREKGYARVAERHAFASLERLFLSHFRRERKEGNGAPCTIAMS